MHDDSTRQTNGQSPPSSTLPPSVLWLALLDIYNYYLREELANYRLLPPQARPPREVFEAVGLLGDWLDVALRDGWIDGVLREPY